MLVQPDVTGGGPLAVVVTFLVAWLFYGVTLHLAATFFVGDVPSQRAAYVGAALAVVALLLQRWGPAVVIPVSLACDVVAVSLVYRMRLRTAAVLTLLHFAFAAALGLALFNIIQFL